MTRHIVDWLCAQPASGQGTPASGPAWPAAAARPPAARTRLPPTAGRTARQETAAPPSRAGNRRGGAWQDCAVRLSTFPHSPPVHSYTVVDLRVVQIVHRFIHRSSRRPSPGRRDRSKLARLLRDRLRARGTYGQGTRQDSPYQGHPQAGPRRHVRWQVPAHAGADRAPCTGHWRPGHGNGLPAEPSKPRAGTGCAGLAVAPPPAGHGAVSRRQGGLGWGVCTRDQRWPAGWERSCDGGHGAHRASRRSTAGRWHQY